MASVARAAHWAAAQWGGGGAVEVVDMPAREGAPDGWRACPPTRGGGEGGRLSGGEGTAPDARRRGEAGGRASAAAALTAPRLGRADAVGRGVAAG